jgi:hypothetical protein
MEKDNIIEWSAGLLFLAAGLIFAPVVALVGLIGLVFILIAIR